MAVNVWLSVMAPPLDEDNARDTFPYEGLNFETGERAQIHSKEELWNIIIAWEMPVERKYLAAINKLASPKNLMDMTSQSLIKQFVYCRDMSTPAFPGSYGDQPAWWLDSVDIMTHNLAAAEEFKANLEKKK